MTRCFVGEASGLSPGRAAASPLTRRGCRSSHRSLPTSSIRLRARRPHLREQCPRAGGFLASGSGYLFRGWPVARAGLRAAHLSPIKSIGHAGDGCAKLGSFGMDGRGRTFRCCRRTDLALCCSGQSVASEHLPAGSPALPAHSLREPLAFRRFVLPRNRSRPLSRWFDRSCLGNTLSKPSAKQSQQTLRPRRLVRRVPLVRTTLTRSRQALAARSAHEPRVRTRGTQAGPRLTHVDSGLPSVPSVPSPSFSLSLSLSSSSAWWQSR
jgi:hypothetical protein